MTYFRAIKPFQCKDHRGQLKDVELGMLVDVHTENEVEKLRRAGAIIPPEYTHDPCLQDGPPADPYANTLRVGIWMQTSDNYSGGRLHVYQYALALDDLGAEVFIITNKTPIWQRDYHKSKRLMIFDYKADHVPGDLDLIVTDSKNEVGAMAAQYKTRHPSIPLVCINFETPNWVEKFCPDYAKSLAKDVGKETFQQADLLIANSNESLKYLIEWIGKTKAHCGALYPAVNTDALAKAIVKGPLPGLPKPYVVWSARSPKYKGGDVAVDAVRACPNELHLVAFGMPPEVPIDEKHLVLSMRNQPDEDKFRAMLGAELVLAPSLFEGCGMVPMEALACGKQCIVYDLPVLREVYGDALQYVAWGDREAYKKKVAECICKPETMAKTDSNSARNKYGLSAMKSKVQLLPWHPSEKNKISVQLIAYWGFMPESLESVYPFADEVLVAFGPTCYAKQVDDGSLERIRSFPDPENKIRIEVRKRWDNKNEMRSWCMKNATGNRMLLLDGDEVWTGLDKWLASGQRWGCPRWVNFWHSPDHWISDGERGNWRWGPRMQPYGSGCPHYRWSQWRPSYRLRTHAMPVDFLDNDLHKPRDMIAYSTSCPDAVIYHFGHALPREIMEAKHEYYLDRDGRDNGRIKRKEVWQKWNGQEGDCGDGIVEKVTWELPEIVKRAAESLRDKNVAVSIAG